VITSPLRKLAAASIIGAGLCLVLGVYAIGLTDENAASRDYIQYWAAGQRIVRGDDPYDRAAILGLEQSKGFHAQEPWISLSPPAAFMLILPLGFMGAKTGLIFWLVLQLGCLGITTWILWVLHGRPRSSFHLAGFAFAPALACLMAGQLGIFFLLGVVLFLYLHDSVPWAAGAALGVCAMKPHLFLPVSLALLLWVVSRKAYRLIAGFAAFILVNIATTLAFDRHILAQYWQMTRNAGMQNVFNPSISVALRRIVPGHPVWLQFLLEAVACIWAVWYFQARRRDWNWSQHGMLLLLVSVACAPYAWFTDEAVLLPAVLAGIYRAVELRRSLLPIALVGGVALIEVEAFVPITSWYLAWTAPAWLAWYLYATSRKQLEPDSLHNLSKVTGQIR